MFDLVDLLCISNEKATQITKLMILDGLSGCNDG